MPLYDDEIRKRQVSKGKYLYFADNSKLDQGLRLDHGTVYGDQLYIKYIKRIGRLVEKFTNLANTAGS